MNKQLFPIGSRWIIYSDNELSDIHTITDYNMDIGLLVTECDGERHEWLPSVLFCLADPMPVETIEDRLERKAADADANVSTQSLSQLTRKQRHKLLYGD